MHVAADGRLYRGAGFGATDIMRQDDGTWLGGPGGQIRGLWVSADGVAFTFSWRQGAIRSGARGSHLLGHGNEIVPWQAWVSDSPENVVWSDIYGRAADDVFASGEHNGSGQLFHFDGVEWVQAEVVDKPIKSLWFAADGTGYAVGDRGFALYNDGTTWEPVDIPTVRSLVAVHGSSPADVFAASADGEVWHFDGATWSEVRGRFATIRGLYAVPNALILYGETGLDVLSRVGPW
jgi:hypothetical protein